MEPPAKRMRILQSVEVDEENPDYINAKQKQQQKFKGRLESIFEKYGNMHESMSDEIDMNTNRVVVDRGHLRRLKRQVGRKETMLLDTLGLAAGKEPEEGAAEEENREYSEDELAPTQPAKSKDGRIGQDKGRQQTSAGEDNIPNVKSRRPIIQEPSTPAASIAQIGLPQASNTPNPTADLLQLVQFPQTPAGQQAQTAFYTTLTQTINQAIQQAVVPLFAGLLPRSVQLPLPNPSISTPADDTVKPPTDPKWFFPPLPAETSNGRVPQSSPLPEHTAASGLEEVPAQTVTEGVLPQTQGQEPDELPVDSSSAPEIPETSPVPSHNRLEESSPAKPRRRSPRVEIQNSRPSSGKKYHFTREEDVYISQQRKVHGTPWAAIRNSREKWQSWPMNAFHNRWYYNLKDRNLHLAQPLLVRVQGSGRNPAGQIPTSPLRAHHLPTPSSSAYEESPNHILHSTEGDNSRNVPSSSAHFDEDERELLSLAGADMEDGHHPLQVDEEDYDPAADEVILPSVETRDLVDEDMLQRDLLEETLVRDATVTPTQLAPIKIKPEPVPSSPASTRRRKHLPLNFEVVPDSDAEEDDGDLQASNTSNSESTNTSFQCNICHKFFKTADNLARHQANPRNTHKSAPRRSASLDLVGDDDLQPPTTSQIKRETSTPPATFLSAIQTPKAIPHRPNLESSGSKSIDRKTYLKQVKQSWTRKSSPAPKSVAKRTSFHTLPRKRVWVDEGSEDELAM